MDKYEFLEVVRRFKPWIEESAPTPEWMPDLTKYLGCGSHGCVYGTQAKNIVFKITHDKAEARMIADITKMANQPEGLVRYFAITEISTSDDMSKTYFGVWREEVTEMGDFDASIPSLRIIDDMEHVGTVIHNTFKRAHGTLQLAFDAQDFMNDVNSEYLRDVHSVYWDQHAAPKRLAIALRMYEALCRAMVADEFLNAVGTTLFELYTRDIVMMDVRYQNLGLVSRDGKPVLVLADPGYAKFLYE